MKNCCRCDKSVANDDTYASAYGEACLSCAIAESHYYDQDICTLVTVPNDVVTVPDEGHTMSFWR